MKTMDAKTKIFGLYVTSNASASHIEFDGKTLCGIVTGTHKNDELRWFMNGVDFKKFVEGNRNVIDKARFCKTCIKIFDSTNP